MGLHFGEAHGKVRCSHLLFQHPLQAASSARRMKMKTVLGVVIERTKKRNPLNVVPMKVGEENVGRNRTAVELMAQRLSQHPKSGAATEDVEIVPEAHFYARGVASVTHIFRLGSGRRPANSPELNAHKPPQRMLAKLPSSAVPSNPSIHSLVTGGYRSAVRASRYNGRRDPTERV